MTSIFARIYRFRLLSNTNVFSARFASTTKKGSKEAKESTTTKKSASAKNSAKASPTVKASTPPPPAQKVATDVKPEVFDNTKYQVPEYYSHKEFSFYDFEEQMKAYRIPQPSSLKPKAT